MTLNFHNTKLSSDSFFFVVAQPIGFSYPVYIEDLEIVFTAEILSISKLYLHGKKEYNDLVWL